nr:hypothetical protein [Tanacetum cinerariifolium]
MLRGVFWHYLGGGEVYGEGCRDEGSLGGNGGYRVPGLLEFAFGGFGFDLWAEIILRLWNLEKLSFIVVTGVRECSVGKGVILAGMEVEGSMKLALVEIRLVEITPLVLSKIIPPIEVVLIILNRRESRRSDLVSNYLRMETGVSFVIIGCCSL